MARRALVPLLGVLAVLAVGCGGGGKTTTTTTTTTAAAPAKSGTVWLCFPGKTPDPCSSSMATTVIQANGSKTVETPKAAANPPIDCFYVYPTVSSENQGNSDLQIQLPQIFVAQAAGEPLLPGLPRLRPDVPPDHRPRTDDAVAARQSVPDLRLDPLGVAGLPRALQPRARRRPDRSFAGGLRAEGPHEARDRPVAGAASPARIGDPARRPGAWRERARRHRRLQAHPALRLRDGDRLRDRLLELRHGPAGHARFGAPPAPPRTSSASIRPTPGRARASRSRRSCRRSPSASSAAATARRSRRRGSPTPASTPRSASAPAPRAGCRSTTRACPATRGRSCGRCSARAGASTAPT